MNICIDTTKNKISLFDGKDVSREIDLYSKEGFEVISKVWLKQEWNQLHWQSFSWFGLPVWQLPEDLVRLQEVVVHLQPDIIVETGISKGGSAIFFATLCRLMGKGRVVSIDICIPEAVRVNIESSPFADLITLIEGDSTSEEVIGQVCKHVKGEKKSFFFLDSDHSKQHVLAELHAYAELVTSGSYIVATDGVMESLTDTPYGSEEWKNDNPAEAAREFVLNHPEFTIQRPRSLFGNEYVIEDMTFWPDAWLLRK